ncbi:MAG TPA: oxygen-independent coproporphyrinogen III oxidase [Gammaproteobacteria bacterium]
MHQTVKFDAAVLRRYDVNGPRYTSYPTAVQFSPSFGEQAYRAAVHDSNDDPIPRSLSLYVHIPFCTSPCFYCACTRIITRDPLKASLYLDRLYREIEMHAALFDRDRRVEQLHLGGGTPTFLSMPQMTELMQRLESAFRFTDRDDREFSIEIDPRTVDADKIKQLAALGFNRISLGVQDFDARVQEAINRVQSVDETLAVIDAARINNIGSINLDLIYGLPCQTLEGFARTLDIAIQSRPERLAVYSYAHLPEVFKAQRQLDAAALPDAETKLALLEISIEKLTGAGYVYIGMDHFALPDDELVIAQRNGSLQRNFQGYSTRAECDMIGMGMSSIGKVGDSYNQNAKDIRDYCAIIDDGRLPVVRGVGLSLDDQLRRDVIQRVMCQGEVVFAEIEQRWDVDFADHFHAARPRLDRLARDGLIEIDAKRLIVTPKGRLLLRVVAMSFDAYAMRVADARMRFSRVI